MAYNDALSRINAARCISCINGPNWGRSRPTAATGVFKLVFGLIRARRFEDAFCGNIAALRHVPDFNGVHDVTIFDAAKTDLRHLPGKYGLIYSFYSAGAIVRRNRPAHHDLQSLRPLGRARGLGKAVS
jgi:hypothetical protein